MATRVEVAAARLLVTVREAKNQEIESWIAELSLETPDGIPAFSEEELKEEDANGFRG
jgi:hypothetical protein